MLPISQSCKNLAKKMANIYKQILGHKGSNFLDKHKQKYTFLIHRIEIIKKIISSNNISLSTLSKEEMIDYLETLLDCHGFCCASGNHSNDLVISNLNLIGRKRELLGNLTDDHVNDFHFSRLFQGWCNIHINKNTQEISKPSGPKCDYAIPIGKNIFELVECKRITPFDLSSINLEKLATKITDKANDEAACQLLKTKEYYNHLQATVNCSNLFIDISAYGQNESNIDRGFESIGFSENKIKELYNLLRNKPIDHERIDQITICWSRKIFKNNLPIAIIQSVFSPLKLNNSNSKINYKGWSVESYPKNKNSSEIEELRVSTCDRGFL